jgi:DNA polymerase epsilon subunit 3
LRVSSSHPRCPKTLIYVQDLLLPRTLTSRLARGVLPPNTSLQKDAILALTKSATVFISYLASHANELTTKKTITPQDVLNAVKEIEMEGIMELGKVGEDGRRGGRLERELELFEESVRGKRKGYREKVKARESQGNTTLGAEEGGEREAKRVKMDEEDEEDLLDAQLNGPSVQAGAVEGDETEDDPEMEDEMDDGDEGEEAEDEDEQEADARDDDDDRLEMDDGGRGRTTLMPNGRAEVGSDDDSD